MFVQEKKEENNLPSFGLESCKRFLLHISLALIPCTWTLFMENIIFYVHKIDKKSRKKSIKKKQRRARKEQINVQESKENENSKQKYENSSQNNPVVTRPPNERLMRIRKRKLESVAKVRLHYKMNQVKTA